MTDKRAPVQGYIAGIPWSMHLRAYDVYCKKYSSQPALIDLKGRNCRGGFGTKELDEFIPGWREELSETVRLQEVLAKIHQCCLFEDDNNMIGVTEDPHIPSELFDEICTVLKLPHKPAGNGD